MRILVALLVLLASCGTSLAQGCGPQNPNCIVPTAPSGTNNNQAASTAFVQQAIGANGPTRIGLTSNLTLYVNPSSTTSANCNGQTCLPGSDNNSCLSASLPCLTIGHAVTVAQVNYDIRQQQITIQLSDNNVTGASYGQTQTLTNGVGPVCAGNGSSAALIISGNTTTPTNIVIQGASGNAAFTFVGVTCPIAVEYMQLGATLIGGATTGHGISADLGAKVYYSNITWGFFNTSYSHINAINASVVEQQGPETIIGGAALHWNATNLAYIVLKGNTITCTGTPAFASAFIALQNLSSFLLSGSTFSGCSGVTGTRFIADSTVTFQSGTTDPNSVFPGNANGSINTPSNYLSGILLGQGGPPTAASAPIAAIAGGTAGNILIDQGTAAGWLSKPVSGSCTLASSGAITCATAAPGGSNTDVQFNSSSSFGGDGGFTYAGTGQVAIANSTANTTPLTISGGSITGSSTVVPGVKVTNTLNTSGAVVGAAFLSNTTNTASGNGTLMSVQMGGSDQFSVGVGQTVPQAGLKASGAAGFFLGVFNTPTQNRTGMIIDSSDDVSINSGNTAQLSYAAVAGNWLIKSAGTTKLDYGSSHSGAWTFASAQYNNVGIVSAGSAPSLSGTCTTGSQVGGAFAGTFTATCTAQTVIITFGLTAPNGWNCNAHDRTTPTDSLNQTASSTTTCTLTGTTAAADVISFVATAY